MTREEALLKIIADLSKGEADIQTDNHGQLIIYTNLFYSSRKGSNREIVDEPHPDWNE